MNTRRPPGLALAPRRYEALMYLANHVEASNRDIAAAIGISDDGQASRLLARMEELGLIRNRNPYNHGAPNAWQLTADGRRLVRALESVAGAI
ncbi:MAG TPA: helix-turn-helix domain-containing protein [Solirubrobacteraceae bacterium]|nr:helix-turn-helix domain-containing protein [Solirubrobacteraceae bacterium]